MVQFVLVAFGLLASSTATKVPSGSGNGKASNLLKAAMSKQFDTRDAILDISALAVRKYSSGGPAGRSLVRRQELECPAGDKSCDAIHCCPDEDECREDLGGCCPPSSETCGGFACTLPGYVCCDSWVCEPGTQCAESFGECITGTMTRTATQSQTSQSTSTSTGTSTQTKSSLTTGACGPTPKPRGTGPSLTNPGYCSKVCNVATKEEMSVLNIPNVPGRTDELIRSTCQGMLERANAGEMQNQVGDGEDVLTYNGPNSRQTQSSGLRNCQQQNRDDNLNKVNQCDEYPPGAFNQNTDRQTFTSIPAKQNSGTQGPMLRNLVRQCGLKENDKVLFKVEGGCGQHAGANAVEPKAIRRRDTWAPSGSSSDLWDPFNDASLTYIFIDLGELDDGHYNLDVNLGDQVHSIEVLDNSGDVYASQDSPNGQHTLSFDLSGGINSGMALVAYANTSVSVSYSGTRQLANASTSDASSAHWESGRMGFASFAWACFAFFYLLAI